MSGVGCADLRRYREGKRLTLGETVKAMCASCCCEYIDGRVDCGIKSCPLYFFMPYRAKQPPVKNSQTSTTPPSNMVPTGHAKGKERQ